MKKQIGFKTKGMNRDLSVSAFNPEFAFENRNLRLATNEGNTLMSWVNERGTALLTLNKDRYWSKNDEEDVYFDPNDNTWEEHDAGVDPIDILGTPIGTAIINSNLVLFTTGSHTENNETIKDDCIYVFRFFNTAKTTMVGKLLYKGDLNFSAANPIETLVSYESDNVSKVYWVDGRNQPRLININRPALLGTYNDTSFDFINELELNEKVSVKKLVGANGMFAPGVIQYSFTYYNKNGQETNIFYTTPLLYVSPSGRGGRPDEKIDNAFRIKVKNPDMHFDYMRIYSIQRTSLNGTPICKRIQDVYLKDLVLQHDSEDQSITWYEVSYTDAGTSGDTIDPTELLYKGGDVIIAQTLEQKDGTLFLGNITTQKTALDDLKNYCNSISIDQSSRVFIPDNKTSGDYYYANQLTATAANSINPETRGLETVPCGGFKTGDTYRCGVQFQHKSGKWTEPFWKSDDWDKLITNTPFIDPITDEVTVPTLLGSIPAGSISALIAKGYVKVRPVVVFPTMQDRDVICQGVGCPTLYTLNHVTQKDLHAQSSWFFRTPNYAQLYNLNGGVAPTFQLDGNYLYYTERGVVAGTQEADPPYSDGTPQGESSIYTPTYIRNVEVQGYFAQGNRFRINWGTITLHSPDVEFDDQLQAVNFNSFSGNWVGDIQFKHTMSDINIQTDSPVIDSVSSAGFVHQNFNEGGSHGIVSGLFYEDYLVQDTGNDIHKFSDENSPVKFLVYPWQKNSSLNNDFNRPANLGIQSSKLKKKVISNYRYADTSYFIESNIRVDSIFSMVDSPVLFSSEEDTIEKIGTDIYRGNIDTLLFPDKSEGAFFAFDAEDLTNDSSITTSFTSVNWWRTSAHRDNTPSDDPKIFKWKNDIWNEKTNQIGITYLETALQKEAVRMKYKSTPHIVFKTEWVSGSGTIDPFEASSAILNPIFRLPIIELVRDRNANTSPRYGGTSEDALRENTWVPCGEPIRLDVAWNSDREAYDNLLFFYDYGDTYYQRWDCLKTYAFTPEDINQVVEIGSFMLETRVNIDGRYDKNRGQMNNLNMSPRNFNLMNPVYSQIDNFFSYKIMPKDYYDINRYPNLITWSKTKESGSDVDPWTNITLASVLELDGDKGQVNKLIRFNDQLLCFQDKGISQILYNERVQISTTQGVPIEIANSGKVDGKSYLSDSIGCSNKWSIVNTPSGIYFMDSNDKSIYLFNGKLTNISQQGGFNAWCKDAIPSQEVAWTPNVFNNFAGFYDRMNQDVLYVNNEKALAFSEKLGVFTSFYDYGGTPFFCNLDDIGIWVRNPYTIAHEEPESDENITSKLWKHQAGNYCEFFGNKKPYSTVLVGNPEPLTDKVFTNLEFRACIEEDGYKEVVDGNETGRFIPYLPLDKLETWNEYQHGIAYLENKQGHSAMMHHTSDMEASLKRKFRIWRCDIPRDNYTLDGTTQTDIDTEKGIARYSRHPNDRMRNPWIYLELFKAQAGTGEQLPKTEIHDIVMTYFN